MAATPAELPLEVVYTKVRADSQLSLYYLRAVDVVLDGTTEARNNAETAERAVRHFTQLVESGNFDRPIDQEGGLEEVAALAETTVRDLIQATQKLHDSLLQSVIPKDDAEVLSESSEGAIYALQKLHDAMVDLRWAVVEHDADLEKPSDQRFGSAEELIAELRKS